MRDSKFKIYSYALLSMSFWGLSFIWYKIVYKYYQPMTTVFLRLLISSILLISIGALFKKHQKIERADYKWIFLVAFFEPFLYFMGESYGMKYVSATLASIIISTIPILTPFFARAILKERITGANIAGLVISFFGMLLLILKPNLSLAASPLGVSLMFFAVLGGIGFTLSVKHLSHRYSSITLVTWQNIIGAILFLPLFATFEFNHFIIVPLNFELVKSVLQLAIFPSTLAFLMLIPVIRALGVSRAAVLTNLIPVFTAIFAYFILDETFNGRKLLGMGVVLAGLFIAQMRRKKEIGSKL
jgi:drug/metabolite transporter (DMT)-like permease